MKIVEFMVTLYGTSHTGPSAIPANRIQNENTEETMVELQEQHMGYILSELRFLQDYYRQNQQERSRGIGNLMTRVAVAGTLDERDRRIYDYFYSQRVPPAIGWYTPLEEL